MCSQWIGQSWRGLPLPMASPGSSIVAPEGRSEADGQADSNADPVSGRLHLVPPLHLVDPTLSRTWVSGHHPRPVFTRVTSRVSISLCLGGAAASCLGGAAASQRCEACDGV